MDWSLLLSRKKKRKKRQCWTFRLQVGYWWNPIQCSGSVTVCDLPDTVRSHILLFADDTNIFRRVTTIKDSEFHIFENNFREVRDAYWGKSAEACSRFLEIYSTKRVSNSTLKEQEYVPVLETKINILPYWAKKSSQEEPGIK